MIFRGRKRFFPLEKAKTRGPKMIFFGRGRIKQSFLCRFDCFFFLPKRGGLFRAGDWIAMMGFGLKLEKNRKGKSGEGLLVLVDRN